MGRREDGEGEHGEERNGRGGGMRYGVVGNVQGEWENG